MGFWQRLTAPFRPRNDISRDDPTFYWRWLSLDQPAGITITAENALDLSVVWGCVLAITNAIGPSKWNIFRVSPGSRDLLWDDPLYDILNRRPNPDMTAIAFKEAMMFSALTWGNAYAEIVESLSGRVRQLWPLMPHRTVPRRDRDTGLLYYEHQQYAGGVVKLRQDQVFHLRGPGITGLMGDNVVARAAKAMGLFAAQERFASTYFGNNTNIGGVLTYPKTLTPEAFKKLKDDWEDKHKGPFKAHRPVILENGLEWKPFEAKADDAQLVESRQMQIEEICFVPGTKIVTADGLRPIESIAVGDRVLTHKGRWRRVSNTMQRLYSGAVVTAQAKGLERVTATENHPFLVQQVKPSRTHSLEMLGEPTWTAAAELHGAPHLQNGARSRRAFQALCIPRLEAGALLSLDLSEDAGCSAVVDGDTIRASDNARATPVRRHVEADYDLGWLCGLFAADGSATDHQVVFYLGAHETDRTAQLVALLDRVFGVGATTTLTPGNVARTVVSNRVLARFFRQFGHASAEKRLPEWCFSGGSDLRRGLIDGVAAGDGCRSAGYTLVKTTSQDLAWQLRLLLLAEGVNCSISETPAGTWSIENRSGASLPTWTAQWRTTPTRRGTMGLTEDFACYSLDRVERSYYEGPVFNLEVEADESYTTVGGVVHNCRYYGVPPHKVQHLLRATFSNIEHLGIEFARDAITPWAVRLEQEADFKLLSPRGPQRETKLDIAWLTHGDFKSRMEGYQIARNMGVYSINEIRHKEGDNSIGAAGDIRIVPLNMQTLDALEAAEELIEIKVEQAQLPPAPEPQPGDGGATDDEPTEPSPEGPGAPDGGGDGPGPDSIVRESIVMLFASAFERYQRRLSNREADLARHSMPEAKKRARMADERQKARPWLVDECADAIELLGKAAKLSSWNAEADVLLMADAIDNGEGPDTVAVRLVGQFLRDGAPSQVGGVS